MNPDSRGPSRRGISPIVATVLIIAITLVASVAVGGFTYGIFGSSANTAQVSVDASSVPAAVGLGATLVYCSGGSEVGAAVSGYLALYNSGTAATTATSLVFNYDGAAISTQLSGPCTIAPESTDYVIIISLPYQTSVGVQYGGYVSTSNGAEVLFAGAFI